VGWCLGKITRINGDGRRKIDNKPINFFAFYEVDQEESSHSLELSSYGSDGMWVLLD